MGDQNRAGAGERVRRLPQRLQYDYVTLHHLRLQIRASQNARAHRQNETIAATWFRKTSPKPAQVFSSKTAAKLQQDIKIERLKGACIEPL